MLDEDTAIAVWKDINGHDSAIRSSWLGDDCEFTVDVTDRVGLDDLEAFTGVARARGCDLVLAPNGSVVFR